MASLVAALRLPSTGSVVVAHGLSCPTARGVLPDQGSRTYISHKAQITINSDFSILKPRDISSILHMHPFILILSLNPRDRPKPGIEPRSPAWQVDSLPAEPQRKPRIF